MGPRSVSLRRPILQDPMNGQSYNRYSYVMNNPTNATDPTGFVMSIADFQREKWERGFAEAYGKLSFTERGALDQKYGQGYISDVLGAVGISRTFDSSGGAKQNAKNDSAKSEGGVINSIAEFMGRNMFGGSTDNGYTHTLNQKVNTNTELLFNTGGPYPSGPAAYCHPDCSVTDLVLGSIPLVGTGVGAIRSLAPKQGAGAVRSFGNYSAGESSILVGRWMSEVEHSLMLNTRKVQESLSGTTHVALPANVFAFMRQAAPGSRYVEFSVPVDSLKITGQGWAKIAGPNSLEGRLANKKGNPVPQMPTASDISWIASKLR
jgi:hypothetical protein